MNLCFMKFNIYYIDDNEFPNWKSQMSMALTTWIWNASHGMNSMTGTKFHNMDDNTFIDKNDLDPYVFFCLCESNMCTFFLLQTSFLLYEVYFVMTLLSKRFQWELLHLWLIINTNYCWIFFFEKMKSFQ